jgi:hypothetical protein
MRTISTNKNEVHNEIQRRRIMLVRTELKIVTILSTFENTKKGLRYKIILPISLCGCEM